MSGPYEERDFPGFKKFICKLCGEDYFTLQGLWDHLDRAHPEVNQGDIL